MKNYKELEKMYIGGSDSAFLTVIEWGPADAPNWLTMHELKFGEDGDYSAYVCWGDVEIGDHYKKVLELHRSITIVDDDRAVFDAKADTIKVYQAGEFGCIIHLEGNDIHFARIDIKEAYKVIDGEAVAK